MARPDVKIGRLTVKVVEDNGSKMSTEVVEGRMGVGWDNPTAAEDILKIGKDVFIEDNRLKAGQTRPGTSS